MSRYSPDRLAANLQETVLNRSNVNPVQFGKLWSYPVDGVIFAQPLYVQNLTVGGAKHNVLFVATMNDVIYAFDADKNGPPLWTRDFRTGGATTAPSSWWPELGTNIGILSTPVIDTPSDTGSMFVVAQTVESTSANPPWTYRLHKLSLATGADVVPSSVIAATQSGVTFVPKQQNQRSGLVLVNGQVIICFSGRPYDDRPYHGWLMDYDATTLTQKSVFLTTSAGEGAGIWGSGGAPPVDAAGNVYVLTGNGFDLIGYDGSKNFSESLLKIAVSSTGVMNLADWFTAYNWADLDASDEDLSCNAPMLIPGTDLVAFGSKVADVYVAHTGSLGHLQNNNTQLAAFFHVGVPVTANFNDGDRLLGLAYWNGPSGPIVYAWPAFDSIHSFAFSNNGFTETSSNPITGFGEPGMPISVSANGNQSGTGIVWSTMLSSSGRSVGQPGEVHAFDAEDVKHELWSTLMNSSRDNVGAPAKFVIPVIANGRLYMATSSNVVQVYGLIPVAAPPARTSSIDFVGGGTPMASSEIAGVVPKSNWNSATGNVRTTGLALVDETGAASGANVTWESDNNWSLPITDAPGNVRMMKGYLDTGSQNPTTVTVSNLPVSPNGYDVYVFTDGDNVGATDQGNYSLSGNGISSPGITAIDLPNTNFSGTFQQANGTPGNYVHFTINTTSFTLTATPGPASDGALRAEVNGIQIVPVGSTAATYTISGNIASGGTALSGVSVTLNPGGSTVTDVSGNYSFASLPTGSYTVTPTRSGYQLNPTSQTFSKITANQIADFTATGSSAIARTVSIDFVGGGTAMASSESAGVIPKSNWNSAYNNISPRPLALIDETGAANGASVTWQSDNDWSLPITDLPGDARMMRGYLDNGNQDLVTVTVSGLPASGTGYDVYVYTDGDNAGSTDVGSYSIAGAGLATQIVKATDGANKNFNGTFTQAVSSSGNYVKFSSINATSFTVTATPTTAADGALRAPINGIQIVPTASTAARAVSVDFVGSGTPMDASESAGVIAKTNWNSAPNNASAAPLALKDETGASTGATATWASDNNWSLPISDTPGNPRMMKGYLDNGNQNPVTVTVSGLAASGTGYDVYVYTDGDNAGSTDVGTYSIAVAGSTTTSVKATDARNKNFNGTFVQAVNSSGNYVKFSSIDATSFTITATPTTAADGALRAPVNGIQVIPH